MFAAIAQQPAKGDNVIIVHGAAVGAVQDAFLRNGYTPAGERKSANSDGSVIRLRYNNALRSGYVEIEQIISGNLISTKVTGMDCAFSTIAYRWGEKTQFLAFADIAARAGAISYVRQ